ERPLGAAPGPAEPGSAHRLRAVRDRGVLGAGDRRAPRGAPQHGLGAYPRRAQEARAVAGGTRFRRRGASAMKRLVEDAPLSSSEQKLSELLRQIEPATSDPFRKRRIWASLMTTRTRPARRAPWPLRGLAIVALLGGGTAAAALGGKVWGGAGPLGGWFGAAPEETTDSAPRETRTSNPPAPSEAPAEPAGGPPPAPSEIEPRPPATDSAEATQTAPPHAGSAGA